MAEDIEGDRDQDDDAAGEGLVVGGNADQRLALGEHGDERRAEKRPEKRPAAAEKAGTTDDHRSDHVEFLAEARFWRAGLQPRGKDDAGERRAEAGDDVGAELNPPDIDARQSRGELTAADRV